MKGSNRRANWTFKISNNNRPQISWHCEHKWPSCRTFPFICELSSSLFSITFSASHTHTLTNKHKHSLLTLSVSLSLWLPESFKQQAQENNKFYIQFVFLSITLSLSLSLSLSLPNYLDSYLLKTTNIWT